MRETEKEGETEREKERQKDRQTDRQRNRKTETETQRERLEHTCTLSPTFLNTKSMGQPTLTSIKSTVVCVLIISAQRVMLST